MENIKKSKSTIFIIIAIVILGFFVMNDSEKGEDNKESKESKSIPSGYVKIPNPYFKPKEQVQIEFDQVGLEVKFVVTNFDDKAETNKKKIIEGMCDQLGEQPNREYFDADEYGDNYGFYAKKGETLIVGYSDHDYTPKSMDSDSSENSKSKKEDASSVERGYTEDSKYITMPDTVGKTVELQMKEIGAEDPLFAVVVNSIQTYLNGDLEASEIAQEVEYSRDGYIIKLKYNGVPVKKEVADGISEELYNTFGIRYTIN